MMALEDLRQAVRGEILLGENLAQYTSLKIGGNADFFIKPADKADALAAVAFFTKQNTQVVLLGRGSNVLVSDGGVRGAVITLRENIEKVEVDGERVYVEAGADLPALAASLLKQGLGGLENLSGVPGSVGGAVVMNAGAYGKEIFDVIEWVEVIRNGALLRLQKDEIDYRYRGTDLFGDIILATELKLKRLTESEKAESVAKRNEWMTKRRDSQPLNLPNAGSIFKNPPPDAGGKPRYTGQFIEACGLKGTRIGGALISEKHANFIVNTGGATANEVMALIDLIKTEVKQKFDIELELEIKLIGFQNAGVVQQ